MSDGKVNHVNENRIPEFVFNSNAMNVIFEEDNDFGQVEDEFRPRDRMPQAIQFFRPTNEGIKESVK